MSNKENRHLLLIIVGYLISIFLALASSFFLLEIVLESHMENSYWRGQGYFERADYQRAEKSYRSALFCEKYLVLTNDNSNLPSYCSGLARALMNEYRYEEAYQYTMASFDAFARFRPDAAAEMASTDLLAVMLCSLTDRDEEELEYAQRAYTYYSSEPGAENRKTSLRTGAWMGHCYFEAGDYSTAYDLFQKNLLAYYESIDWGVGDESEADFVIMACKCAKMCEEKLTGLEDTPFSEQFQRLLYIREKQESEVDELASQLGWSW